ncbi:unnamed protein product [Mytilus edulis]|uniref:Peptidase A2 domain-containing protein n=1 Tax=Mytilus edulis TaxID=6550 RepID=A0A8S3RC11_MYTED|nr:unnamed protein product [Mytilus edulis]
MEKRQQSIPKKEIECLKGKFVTSEKNSSEKHLTTEGLGPSSSDVKIISKKSDQCKKHFEDNESSDDSVDGENSVCINRVESAVIQTSVRINDYELKAVIDTGAEVTVLSEKVYRNLAKEHHLELKTATRGLLVAEEGKKMSATGITEIEMSLGPLRFTWPRRESNRLLKYHSGQRADAHQQGGSLKEEGNSYQRSDKGRARGGNGHYNRGSDRQCNQWNNQGNYSGRYNRGNDRQVNQANNRDNYRQENRQHNQEERPQRTEFDQTQTTRNQM